MRRNLKRNEMRRDDFEEMGWTPEEIDNNEELALLSAVCQIISIVRNSKYDPKIFEYAARPIRYIASMLEFTEREAIVYAIVMDKYYDRQLSTYDVGRCLDLPPIKSLKFYKEFETLCERRYLIRNNNNEESIEKLYCVSSEAIESLQQNRPIEKRSSTMTNLEDWFDALNDIIEKRCYDNIDCNTLQTRIEYLVTENRNLPFVKKYTARCSTMADEEKMLFLWICNMLVSDGYESVVPENFKKVFARMSTYRAHRKALSDGSHILIEQGLLRVAASNDTRSRDCYELTPLVINDMLSELNIELSNAKRNSDLLESSTIEPKQLFYNAREEDSISQLTELLQPERFVEVRRELRNKGFRSGFACLFHGAPGTGKTETVLQLARSTGRNIMQVDISTVKSMWVGESEKNIKAIFTRYRKLVEESELAPILLFNEADAIIGKRLENVERSTDKMENAMQNIILEEIEKLDGILIATTNLTCNMDKAFERRFLYKIEFSKPSLEAKRAIWKSMITDLTDQDATVLASKYDFSGGQIENIARKSVVDKIITGKELSLEAIRKHCDSEQLDKNAIRKSVGF